MVRPLKRWQPTSMGSVPMGHEISVTSVQLAQLGSVIANGGFLVHPRLVAWTQALGQPKELTKFPAGDPQQVLEPRTVMTMRRLMHRVVMPGGTASRLHVVGYAVAGKTGTAQIFDYAHHVYTHKYNASFLGFAPLEDPAVVIVVTVSGTTGVAGFGSVAAGPVFERVMGAALRRLGIVRDVPEEVEELLAKQKAAEDKLKKKDTDSDTVAGLSVPFTAEEINEAKGSEDDVPVGPKAPNFVGKTVKTVMEEAAAQGLEVDMLGSGLARAQNPPAGAALAPGAHIQVRFAR